jgi:hypothetical protein
MRAAPWDLREWAMVSDGLPGGGSTDGAWRGVTTRTPAFPA